MSFRVFGQVIVVLNSAKTSKDLLEKRGDIYSDRPVIPFFDMCVLLIGIPTSQFIFLRMGCDWVLPTARYNERWHQGRKVLDRSLRPVAAALYRPMQQSKTRVFLTRLLESPSEWEAHVELSATFVLGLLSSSNHFPIS